MATRIMKNNLPTFCGSAFTWRPVPTYDPQRPVVASAEASDFGSAIFGAAGFNIRSHRTGKVQSFLLEETIGDWEAPEAELEGWIFRSEQGVRVMVFND